VQAQERAHFLAIIQTLQPVATPQKLQAICEGLRAGFATTSPTRHAWGEVAPELLRALWETMERIGGTTPSAPEVATAKLGIARGDDHEAYIRKVLDAINDVVRWCEAKEADAPEKRSEAKPTDAPSRKKRSTERGEGRAKLIAALTNHHQYADGSCLNLEPIGNNELAKAAVVSPSTASTFFNDEFEGHTKYKALCRDSSQLAAALKLLNNEFSPHDLYGRRPTGEDDRDDEGDE
jgi:hypothetical protein